MSVQLHLQVGEFTYILSILSPDGIFRAKNNDNKQSKVTLVTTIPARIQ